MCTQSTTRLSLEIPGVPDLAQKLPGPLHQERPALLVVLGFQKEIPEGGERRGEGHG